MDVLDLHTNLTRGNAQKEESSAREGESRLAASRGSAVPGVLELDSWVLKSLPPTFVM